MPPSQVPRRQSGSAPAPTPADGHRVDRWLHDDPAFQVLTVDGLGWVCPFTGTVVPAPFGFREPAREWLLAQKPWQRARPLAQEELQTRRWEHWLKVALPKAEHAWLRWFLPDGRWLNPFTGEFLIGIEREGGRITLVTVAGMAAALCGCPQAQGGQPLPRDVLESRLRDAAPPSGLERKSVTPPRQPTPTPPGGVRVVHGYRVIEKLGEGAMGTVYKAVQVSLQREVALKVIDIDRSRRGERTERFLREARSAASINHPNVVACYDVGEHGDRLYMALELVTGGDAEEYLRNVGGRAPERRALEIARDCARGLQAVAAAGLVHRDIKPANIFLAADGTAKLGDLGLVRAAGIANRTSDGTLVGTPAFMSPEQARSEPDIDVRSDLYAIGATLYALLTGEAPFSGESVFAVMHMVITAPPPDPRLLVPAISPATVRVLTRAMAKRREERFQRPAELVAAIDQAIAWLDEEESAVGPTTVRVDLAGGHGPEVAACQASWHLHQAAGAWTVVAVAGDVALTDCGGGELSAALTALPDDRSRVAVRVDGDGQLTLVLGGESDVLVLGIGDVLARRVAASDRLEPGETLLLLLGADPRRAMAGALGAQANASAIATAAGAAGPCVVIRLPKPASD